LQKAGELESLIPGRKSASAPKKILKRFPGDAWDPEPVVSEATKLRSRKRRQLRDIIGLLVGIYGGKELFVNEYRLMLADKLLQKSNYDAERETLALELLKNKFGETHLHDCEVMLRDVNDSRRVNANVKTRPAEGTPLAKEGIRTTEMLKESPVQALILSKLFWPKDIAKSAATIVAPASTQASLPHPVSAPSIVPSLGQEQEPVQMTMNTNEMYVGEEEEVDGLNDPTSAACGGEYRSNFASSGRRRRPCSMTISMRNYNNNCAIKKKATRERLLYFRALYRRRRRGILEYRAKEKTRG
jgi:hypothetical protein